MKVVCWQIVQRGSGFFVVKFWPKDKPSSTISEKVVTLEEQKLRTLISNVTGLKNFELERMV